MQAQGGKTFIYVIGAAGLPAVKIGMAGDPVKRLSDLQVGSPVKLAVLWTYEWQFAKGDPSLEKALHRRFAAKRLHGEWFDLGPDPVPLVRAAARDLAIGAPPADDEPEVPATALLDAIADVWPAGTDGLATHQLANLLAGHKSGAFGWPALARGRELDGRLRDLGIVPVRLQINGMTMRGYDRAAILLGAT